VNNCLVTLQGVKGRNVEEFFVSALEGTFDALHIPEVQDKAEASYENLRKLFSKKIFAEVIYVKWECDRHLAVFSSVDAIPHAMVREQPDHARKARAIITEDLVSMKMRPNVTYQDIMLILHQIAN
jgi:transformation/transcription domain-associated protein